MKHNVLLLPDSGRVIDLNEAYGAQTMVLRHDISPEHAKERVDLKLTSTLTDMDEYSIQGNVLRFIETELVLDPDGRAFVSEVHARYKRGDYMPLSDNLRTRTMYRLLRRMGVEKKVVCIEGVRSQGLVGARLKTKEELNNG